MKILWAAVVFLFLFSCRTMPMGPFPDVADWLPEESDMVLRFIVNGNESLAESLAELLGVNAESVKPILERTAMLAAGLEMDGGWEDFSQIPIHAVAIGIWPRGVLGGVLGKDWKRKQTEKYGWSGPGGLDIAVPTNEEILLSRGRLAALSARRASAFVDAGRRRMLPMDADLALWVSNPALVAEFIPMAAGRIDSFSAAIRKGGNRHYSVDIDIYPTEDRLAPSLVLALRLALSARFGKSPIPQERELLPKMKVEMKGRIIRLSLSPVELALLTSLAADLEIFGEDGE